MRIRAAVLEETRGALAVQELELAAPRPHEVLVRLRASGVCHSDLNAIDGTAETPCPAVLGHEGAGVVEVVGEKVTRVVPGDHVALSWLPSCGECAECVRGFTWLCSTAWPAMSTGGLDDGTTRLSRDGEPVYHYSFLSTFAEACVVSERSCVPIAHDIPFDVAALVGCAVTTGVGAVARTAGAKAGDRVAVIGCGGVGLSALMAAVALGAEQVVAVDVVQEKLDVARSFGATARRPLAGERRGDGGGGEGCIRWRRGRGGRGDGQGGGDAHGVPVDTEARCRRARSESRPKAPCSSCRRERSRAGERRVLGSIYGSSHPDRDFPATLELYRDGRLPLDRLIIAPSTARRCRREHSS